jgi:putative ubiquitin-RnfH superfamily antitoxin RatB of RatAB toxin-antitoxin module
MAAEGSVEVEVVFALADRQELVAVTVPSGATAADAIEASGIAGKFPDHDLCSCQLGIWGRLVEKDQPLEDGDRVEIYRPLMIDPREARRKLAAEGKSMGRAESGVNDD